MSRRAIVKRGKLRRAKIAKARCAIENAFDRIADAICTHASNQRIMFTEYLIDYIQG